MNISKLADLDRLVATAAFCPEPPASERRAIHGSGAWRWICPGDYPPGADRSGMRKFGHWRPAPFSTDPAASYALEQKIVTSGWHWLMVMDNVNAAWTIGLWPNGVISGRPAAHESRLIAMCLAALHALGVEFELREGWDAK